MQLNVLYSTQQVYLSFRAAKELNALNPGKCVPVVADTQMLSGADKLVDEISSESGAFHVLINNAGAASGDGLIA